SKYQARSQATQRSGAPIATSVMRVRALHRLAPATEAGHSSDNLVRNRARGSLAALSAAAPPRLRTPSQPTPICRRIAPRLHALRWSPRASKYPLRHDPPAQLTAPPSPPRRRLRRAAVGSRSNLRLRSPHSSNVPPLHPSANWRGPPAAP